MNKLYIGIAVFGILLYSNQLHNININNNNYISVVIALIIFYFFINKMNILYLLLIISSIIIFSSNFRKQFMNDIYINKLFNYIEPFINSKSNIKSKYSNYK